MAVILIVSCYAIFVAVTYILQVISTDKKGVDNHTDNEYNPPWLMEAKAQSWTYCESNCNYEDHIETGVEIVPETDERVDKIQRYLGNYGSPLEDYAEVIVGEADKYGVDPFLITAISIKESGGGKKICAKFNPFGIMHFPNGTRKCRPFNSWEEVIAYEAWLLGEYKKAGRDTIEKIGRRYNPDTPNEWIAGIKKIIKKIERS